MSDQVDLKLMEPTIQETDDFTQLTETNQKVDLSEIEAMKARDNHFYKIAKIYADSDIVPDTYKRKPGNCFIAIQLANRMGVDITFVMQHLYIVKGKPSWSGQACVAMVNGCGQFKDGIKFIFVGKENQDDWGCYCKAVKKSDGEELIGTTITVAMAKSEGWWSKKDKYGNETSKWQTMPRQMLMYRAAAFFARVHCPNILMGYSVEGEVEDVESAQPEKKTIKVE